MEAYIIIDLIKYVISDYVIYDILKTIKNNVLIINKDRTIVINTLANANIVIDNCIRKIIKYNNTYITEITNYNTAYQKHGYKLYYDVDEELRWSQLYIKNNLSKEITYYKYFPYLNQMQNIKTIYYHNNTNAVKTSKTYLLTSDGNIVTYTQSYDNPKLILETYNV
jgi:hypothetical protein